LSVLPLKPAFPKSTSHPVMVLGLLILCPCGSVDYSLTGVSSSLSDLTILRNFKLTMAEKISYIFEKRHCIELLLQLLTHFSVTPNRPMKRGGFSDALSSKQNRDAFYKDSAIGETIATPHKNEFWEAQVGHPQN
jgi:hypothetical protein